MEEKCRVSPVVMYFIFSFERFRFVMLFDIITVILQLKTSCIVLRFFIKFKILITTPEFSLKYFRNKNKEKILFLCIKLIQNLSTLKLHFTIFYIKRNLKKCLSNIFTFLYYM